MPKKPPRSHFKRNPKLRIGKAAGSTKQVAGYRGGSRR